MSSGGQAPGETVVPVLTSDNCRQNLPIWGVTREFRFGQFIRLYDERRGADGKITVTPIVLNADGDVVEPRPATTSGAPALRATGASGRVAATPIGMWESPDFERALAGEARTLRVTDAERVIAEGTVDLDGRPALVGLGPDSVAALRAGEPVLAVAHRDEGGPTVVRLQAEAQTMQISAERLDQLLAARDFEGPDGTVHFTEPAIRSLIETGEARAPNNSGGIVTVQLEGGQGVTTPAAKSFVVADLAEFLAAPVIPAKDGSMVRVPLDGDAVRMLRTEGNWAFVLNGTGVRISTQKEWKPDPDWPPPVNLGPAYVPLGDLRWDLSRVRRDWGHLQNFDGKVTGAGGGTTATDPKPADAPQFSKAGLPIAILLPWKQTWKLTGFTRGNLLSSLALAPGEDTRITVASWERRAKSLDQLAETETEQTFDYTSTTRDTEDVFREIVQSNDFHAQANASLDASYSPGVASITVHADGGVTNDAGLAITARNSSQRMRESVTRAATRVTSRRVTRITESVERTSMNEVVRQIRNPNVCHTLTLNFHEVLAHYEIDVVFNRAAVRLVVLVPNPEPTRRFDGLTVRAHEATLRAGLLDAGLVEGFEACRLLAAYQYAEDEIKRLATDAKAELDQERQRTVNEDVKEDKPPNPHIKPLQAILTDLKKRFAPFPGADATPAYKSIGNWKIPPPATEVTDAGRWLWMRLVRTKYGDGLIATLTDLLSTASPGAKNARRLVAAAPPPGGFPALGELGSLSEKEKEDAGLFAASSGALGGPWWWWYPRLKDSGCYNVVDGGIPGLLAALRDKFREWESKESEGAGLEQAQAALERANNEQQKATVADRLEMKFGAEVVGSAFERREALLAHLNEHLDYYRFVLFQGMPPSEQLQRIVDLAPALRVGTFEPHVVACDGPNLAIPLTPVAETTIAKVVTNLSDRMEKAAEEALEAGGQIATDHVVLPTPGISVESWLGDCSGCEEHTEQQREAQARLALAEARIRELEAARRKALLDQDDTSDPDQEAAPTLRISLVQEPRDE
uniref:hypothetical protein n=1 Tax=Paractinoplanes polyasparticus TaxID=2856853 RepID=UPI001C843621|nr:hypothetical protein [Actinoplanes polyasparticus]